MIEIATTEISKANEIEETFEMEQRKGKHTKIFLPSILKDTYSTGNALKQLRILAEKIAKEEFFKTYST